MYAEVRDASPCRISIVGESELMGRRSRLIGQPDIELDEESVHIVTPLVVSQDSDDVAALSGAKADELDPARWALVEHLSKSLLDDGEPPAQKGGGVLVRFMPPDPMLFIGHARKRSRTLADDAGPLSAQGPHLEGGPDPFQLRFHLLENHLVSGRRLGSVVRDERRAQPGQLGGAQVRAGPAQTVGRSAHGVRVGVGKSPRRSSAM